MSMTTANDDLIREHYRKLAATHGDSPRSSMEDDFVRERELEWITSLFWLLKRDTKGLNVLDLGCGNGYALSRVCASARPSGKTGKPTSVRSKRSPVPSRGI